MKKFFEEYGFVILASIVLIVLISICFPTGKIIKIKVEDIVLSFSNKEQSSLNAIKVHDKLGEIRFSGKDIFLDVYSDNPNAYKAIVHYTFAGKEETRTLQNLIANNDIKLPADKDTYIWMELINKETGEIVKTSKEIVKQETLQYGYWELDGNKNVLKISNYNPEHKYQHNLFYTHRNHKQERETGWQDYKVNTYWSNYDKLVAGTDLYALIKNKTTGEIFGTHTIKMK